MWMWIAAGGGVLYYLYTKNQKEPEGGGGELPPTEVVEVDGVFYEKETVLSPTPKDKVPEMVRYLRKLAGVMTARMPFIDPIKLPKTVTRAVVDEALWDLQDEFDGCFGPGEWQDFILGPYMTKAQRRGFSKKSTDDQRLTALVSYIAFFEQETDALKGFLGCMKSEHAPPPSTPLRDPRDEELDRPPVHGAHVTTERSPWTLR